MSKVILIINPTNYIRFGMNQYVYFYELIITGGMMLPVPGQPLQTVVVSGGGGPLAAYGVTIILMYLNSFENIN